MRATSLLPRLPETLDEAYRIVLALWAQIVALRARVDELEEKLRTNSGNSSKPPSSDGPQVAKRAAAKPPSGRKRGAQPGHPGHARPVLCADLVDEIVECPPPPRCACGGTVVLDEAAPAQRHQVAELPPVKPKVTEYRRRSGTCDRCGRRHHGVLPAGVPQGGLGARALAIVALLSGRFHLSKRAIAGLLADLCGLDLSLGAVSEAEGQVSAALKAPVAQAQAFVREQAVVHADETGHRVAGKRSWVWVAVTATVAAFFVGLSRTTASAKRVLGETFAGLLVTDRFAAYGFVATVCRQWCWAHLIRDFRKIAERGGRSAEIATALLGEVAMMFGLWHQARDGPLSRAEFRQRMEPVRQRVEALLWEGTHCGQAKTERTCAQLLKRKAALWTFVDHEGVEPTNNEAERTIRKYVLWRKGSFGTQGEGGNRFVERLLTVSETCRRQGRHVLGYLTAAVAAHLHGDPAPSLLPDAAVHPPSNRAA